MTASSIIVTTTVFTIAIAVIPVVKVTTVTVVWRTTTVPMVAIITTFISSIGRRLENFLLPGLNKHISTKIMRINLTIDIIKSSIRVTINRGDQIIVGGIKAVKNIANHLIILHGFASSSEFRREPLHLGEKLICGQSTFLGVVESTAQMIDTSAGGSREHLRDNTPYLRSMLETKNMSSNFWRKRVHEKTKYRLISGHPRRIGWVRNCNLLAVLVINLQRLLQSSFSAIKKPKSKSTTDRRENKCELEQIV
jgi:hypothetical protein